MYIVVKPKANTKPRPIGAWFLSNPSDLRKVIISTLSRNVFNACIQNTIDKNKSNRPIKRTGFQYMVVFIAVESPHKPVPTDPNVVETCNHFNKVLSFAKYTLGSKKM